MKNYANLEVLTKSFEQSCSGIMSITKKDSYHHLKAVYGRVFVKPSKRLATLLSTDKEVLVLFSGFADQQVRTISTVQHIIEEEAGRIESTLAIVVHRDSSGNAKLKKWGRDCGISVLPIHSDGSVLKGADFERILCRELFSHDPFDVTGPVSDDSQFYGRRTEAQDLARQLQKGQIRTCLGIRKIGKTSIVNRVINAVRDGHESHCVMVDCSKDEIWGMHANELTHALAIAVQTAQQTDERYVVLEDCRTNQSLTKCSQELLKAITGAKLPVLIFFDEVDYITPGSPTAGHWRQDFNPFWRNFRAIYQEAMRKHHVLSILISGVSSKWFTVESIDGVENAALHFIPEEHLNPLQRGASAAMIKTIARTCGLQFDEETGGLVAEACCDIPFWIRKACSYIHRNTDVQLRPLKLARSTVEAHLERFVDVEGGTLAKVALSHLFKVFPELEPPALLALENTISKIPKTHASQLERYGILATRAGTLALSGQMMKSGLKAYSDSKNEIQPDEPPIVTAPKSPSLAFSSTDDWADELALINRRRNLLEKKMRDIVLNFLRFDSLSDKVKPAASERILKVVQAPRKTNLAQLPTDQVMTKLLWTELIQLVEREWTLFERLFGDKTAFSSNAKIVNDRFDAHAKDADFADLALYRRSLKALEDSVASL